MSNVNFDLGGRTVVVTGAAQGIGEACSLRLARDCSVASTSIDAIRVIRWT